MTSQFTPPSRHDLTQPCDSPLYIYILRIYIYNYRLHTYALFSRCLRRFLKNADFGPIFPTFFPNFDPSVYTVHDLISRPPSSYPENSVYRRFSMHHIQRHVNTLLSPLNVPKILFTGCLQIAYNATMLLYTHLQRCPKTRLQVVYKLFTTQRYAEHYVSPYFAVL